MTLFTFKILQKVTLKDYLLGCFFFLSLAGYLVIGYGIERSNFDWLITVFAVLFFVYFLSLKWIDTAQKIKFAVGAAIIFRISLLFSFPTLSDDFYRFIWDGRLLAHGINPFAHTPQLYIQNGLPSFLSIDLYNQLNSQTNYTIYPPVHQFIFWIAAGLGGTNIFVNIVVMKVVIVLFEAATFWVMAKLLRAFNLPLKYLLIYALNPLIILELSGNLHFEGVMIFFLLAAFYLFLKNRLLFAAACFLLAVNTKLIPLILFPYLIFSLRWKKWVKLIAIIAFGTAFLHIPFLGNGFFAHFGDSLALYFQSFEFNASIYYLVRWIGYQFTGYNIIHTAAPVLAVIAALLIVFLSWKMRDSSLKNSPLIFVGILTVYLLFSTTVHSWYIVPLIAFAPFTGLIYPIAWSGLIPLTYITYITPVYDENLWLVAVEYLVVFGVMVYDFYRRKKGNGQIRDIDFSRYFDRRQKFYPFRE